MNKIVKIVLIVLMAISVALVAWVVATTPEEPTVADAPAVGSILMWGYALAAIAVVVALLGSAMDMVSKPDGIKGTILSIVLVAAIAVISYVVANGHDYQIVDLGNQGFFAREETVFADACILGTYVVGAAAILAAIYSAVSDALK